MLKHLTSFHSVYQLTSRDLTLISGDSIKEPAISLNSLQKIVKYNLEAIILALLNRGAICGSDLIEIIHTEFKVLLSPGTIYPLLHSLYEKGLVTWIKDGKEKKYVYTEDSESKIKRLIKEYIGVQKSLNSYLNKEMNLEEEVNQYIK
ncbi:MAG: helix-turn-helix transcriptional regulator [Pseudomonadota bacterium]